MRAILTYHSIDDSGSPVSVSEPQFRRHVAWLASGVVRVVGLKEIAALPREANAVALTFDDGFVNFAERAWPLLRAHALPVTLFVVTDGAGGTNAWGGRADPGIPTLPLLDWDALARLGAEGVALGAHGRTHADLRTVHGAALEDEVAGAAERVAARTGRRPAAFAYPYGALSEGAVEAAARAYSLACTTQHRVLPTRLNPLLLPRLDAFYFRAGGLDGWGTAAFRARIRARGALRRLRRFAVERQPR
jgi:peptidoglycan/xylan/chitin deacetylase (PgdA/CDA1 family)